MLYMYILQEEECCCDQRFVAFSCMNKQLKCMEMLVRNFLNSLEQYIAPKGQYLLGVNNFCK